jgi:hypothetical protein
MTQRNADRTPYSRRSFLRDGACAAGALALAGPLAAVPPSMTARVALSRFLCGFPNLDSRLVARAFVALIATEHDFAAHADALALAITAAALPDVQAFRESPLYGNATHRATALALLGAFYLGFVGNGGDAQLVSYEAALMFASTQDVTPIPSYACGGPGYWGLIDAAATG